MYFLLHRTGGTDKSGKLEDGPPEQNPEDPASGICRLSSVPGGPEATAKHLDEARRAGASRSDFPESSRAEVSALERCVSVF